MEKRNIDNKIEQTLSSLDNIQQAEANPFLYTKIMGRLQSRNNALQYETKKFLRLSWELALAMILFIGLNIAAFVYFNHQDDNEYNSSITSLANEYSVNPNNYNYY